MNLIREKPVAGWRARTFEAGCFQSPAWSGMSLEQRERLGRDHRLRRGIDISAVKAGGTPFRGRYCVLLVLARPAEPTRFGFIASRRSVGGAVQRNRARRRLREIVRRRWPRIVRDGYWMMFIAMRGALAASHQALATEVEHQLASAGALAPISRVAH